MVGKAEYNDMSAIITPSTDSPSLTGLLVNGVNITACSPLDRETDAREMFGIFVPRYEEWADSERGRTLFSATGWNSVSFHFDAPVFCSHYKVWFSADFNSGIRATSRFRILTGESSDYRSFTLLDDVQLARPYIQHYGSNTVCVENDMNVSAQYFQIWFHGLSWGARTDGPRISGFQIT